MASGTGKLGSVSCFQQLLETERGTLTNAMEQMVRIWIFPVVCGYLDHHSRLCFLIAGKAASQSFCSNGGVKRTQEGMAQSLSAKCPQWLLPISLGPKRLTWWSYLTEAVAAVLGGLEPPFLFPTMPQGDTKAGHCGKLKWWL